MMKPADKGVVAVLMWIALFFGFANHFIPKIEGLHFERLHIFLFNLCAGGSIIYSYTIQERFLSLKTAPFLIISFIFALAAFSEFYIISIICAFTLSFLAEMARSKRFGFFPWMFFKRRVIVHRKFHNASMLCLSMGLFISALVMINNEYLKAVQMDKLELNTFFLGFSFPLSLITMSVMFKLTGDNRKYLTRVLKNIGFWAVNLGVIIFFLFILFELMVPQLIISIILFSAVILIFYVFASDKLRKQQRTFLVSGMFFLLFTGVSGIAYILLEMTTYYTPETGDIILRMHSFTSVYGWNLSGLAVLSRFDDFPIELHSIKFIALHWLTALFFAPFGSISIVCAVLAIVSYGIVMKWIFFSNSAKKELISAEGY
jgi:hypothetical protein